MSTWYLPLLSFALFCTYRTLLRDQQVLVSTVTSTRRYISTCCIGVQSFEQVFRSQISTALALSSTSHKHLRTRLAKNAVSARGLKAFHYEKLHTQWRMSGKEEMSQQANEIPLMPFSESKINASFSACSPLSNHVMLLLSVQDFNQLYCLNIWPVQFLSLVMQTDYWSSGKHLCSYCAATNFI